VTLLTRRPVLIGLAATVAAVATGIALDIPNLFRRRATGPYASLVNAVEDPDSAAIVGRAILGRVPLTGKLLEQSASFARDRLAKETLQDATAVDAARSFLVEADGWVLPITLGTLCILATQSTDA
jgi:hypothetical protein